MTWNNPPARPNVVPKRGCQQTHIEEAVGSLETAVSGDKSTAFLWTGGKEAQVIADLLLYAVGEAVEVSPVPFVIIETGNQFEAMKEFRQKYVAPEGDNGAATTGPPTGVSDVRTIRYDEMLEQVIHNPADPRGYHGEYGIAECPHCGEGLLAAQTDADYECPDCGFEHTVPEKFRPTLSKEEWGVPESCGALKIVPMRRVIEDYGFDTLITGRRSEDPLTPGKPKNDELDVFEERRSPAPHTRVNPLASWEEANVYAYLKAESVSLPSLYTEEGYRHTDMKCCVDHESDVGEYGEGGRDPEKVNNRAKLEQLGYI